VRHETSYHFSFSVDLYVFHRLLYTTYCIQDSVHLKQAKELLWLFLSVGRRLDTLHLVHVGRLVVATKLGSGTGDTFRRPPATPGSSPVKAFPVAENGHTLFLLVSSARVVFVRFEPRLFLGSLHVRVVPCPATLHVCNSENKTCEHVCLSLTEKKRRHVMTYRECLQV